MSNNSCPIIEQTGDGTRVGRCWFHLRDNVCPRHGEVKEEIERYRKTKECTLENDMRKKRVDRYWEPKYLL